MAFDIDLVEEVKQHYLGIIDVLSQSERPCYIHFDEKRFYPEMWSAIRAINNTLSNYRGVPIALYTGKSFETYSAIHAILLSGNVWLPLNPDHPPERNKQMLEIAQPSMIISDCELPDELTFFAKESEILVMDLSELTVQEPLNNFPIEDFSPEEISIIYFTSGSTGKPKGVPVTRQSYIRNINNILEVLPLKKGDIFADYHDLGFIISVPIIFPCILCEGALVPAKSKSEMIFVTKSLVENRINVLITVPSTLARIRKASPEGVNGLVLNTLIMCGEPFHLDLLDYCTDKIKPEAVFNFYGSTEVGPWTFFHKCSRDDISRFEQFGMVPIGTVLSGNNIMIEDDELLCAGPQITPGYLGRIGKDRFIENDNNRWYRTGDKVVKFEDVYVCKGRLDAQVKIDGYRVDLGEAEAHLRSLDGVTGVVCFIHGEGTESEMIAALNSKRLYTTVDVRAHLKKRLPAYMMPRKIMILKEWPLNKNGKVDRVLIKEMFKASKNGVK